MSHVDSLKDYRVLMETGRQDAIIEALSANGRCSSEAAKQWYIPLTLEGHPIAPRQIQSGTARPAQLWPTATSNNALVGLSAARNHSVGIALGPIFEYAIDLIANHFGPTLGQ